MASPGENVGCSEDGHPESFHMRYILYLGGILNEFVLRDSIRLTYKKVHVWVFNIVGIIILKFQKYCVSLLRPLKYRTFTTVACTCLGSF